MRRRNAFVSNWKIMFALSVFLFAVSTAFAQSDGDDLEETLNRLSNAAAQGYVGPIVSAFGSNLNGGWFHKTPPPKIFGLNLEFGLVGMGTMFPDEGVRRFTESGDFRFDRAQASEIIANTIGITFPDPADQNDLITAISQTDFTVGISGATIIGASDDYIEISFSGASIEYTPSSTGIPVTVDLDPYTVTLDIAGFGDFLTDVKFLPFLAPQLEVGTVLGTQAVFRYFPEIEMPFVDITEDIGTFSWFGWGVQHNPAVFFPTPLPLDVSFCFAKQTLKLGEIFEADTTAYGITVSKKLGIGLFNLTPYAGYLIERSELNFHYDYILDEGTPWQQNLDVDFTLKGENKSRITVGLSVKLLMFNINADYNIGNYNSITVGVMVGI